MDKVEEKTTKGYIYFKSPNAVEWKVPDFFVLPDDLKSYESPTFRYLDAEWCLGCCPKGGSNENLYLFLMRVQSSSNHTFTYRLGLKSKCGHNISNSVTEEFEFDGAEWGTSLIITTATIFENKELLAPEGNITFFCIFPFGIDKESQTQEIELAQEYVKEISSDFDKEDTEADDTCLNFTSKTGLKHFEENLKGIYLREEHSDFLIKVKDEELKAHKLVLGAWSSVFSSMFAHDTLEKMTNAVEIPDCEPGAFRHFLTFLYSGQVENVPQNQVYDLYFIADKYNVTELKKVCVKFLRAHITVDTFCDVMTLALRHSDETLKDSATDYFKKYMKKIIVTDKWQSLIKLKPIECNDLYIEGLK